MVDGSGIIFIICMLPLGLFGEHRTGSTNYCPEVKGCICDLMYTLPGNMRLKCVNAVNPQLHLIPHENITRITLHKCNFTDMSLLDELRKTNAGSAAFLSNIMKTKNGTKLLNWDWIPSKIKNISLVENGFQGFEAGGMRDHCDTSRFNESITIYLKKEAVSGIPSCIPDSTGVLSLSDLLEQKDAARMKWTNKIEFLKISGTGFKNLSTDFARSPPSLTKIWMNKLSLNNGHWPMGLSFTFLKRLMVTNSKLSHISTAEIKRLRAANKLKQFILNNNDLSEIPLNLPATLETLQISHNKIEYVSEETWTSIPNLIQLDLSNNLLSTVPLGMPSTLQKISLHENMIAYSDAQAFNSLKQLTTLDLSHNRLSTMPRGILTGLQKYLLSDNQISLVQDSSGYEFCTKCTTITLHGNPWYCDVEMLKMLSWMVSHSVTMIGNLGYQKDDGDFISHCSSGSFQGTDSSWIGTAIEAMKYFKQPPNDKCKYEIKKLTCRNAGIAEVPAQIPPNLVKLDISDNPNITNIPDNKFSDQKKMLRLYLNNNSLAHVPIGLPQSITLLSMQNNELGNWSQTDLKAFQNLTSLRELYLEDNKIKVLYSWQFENLKDLDWIGLGGNSLHCDCSIESFAIWFETRVVFDDFVAPTFPTCATPQEVIHRDIRQLYGYFSFGLQCTPQKCKPQHNSQTMNCSAAFLKEDKNSNIFLKDFVPGIVPVVPLNTYYIGLDLSGLKLNTSQISYRSLPRLKHINLSDNNNTEIPYMGLPSSTEDLDLSYNLIENLPTVQTFKQYLPHLTILDLSHNKIINLDSTEVGNLEIIQSIVLTGNPFSCNCSLRPLAEWIDVNKENAVMMKRHKLETLTCHTKKGVEHVIKDMKENEFCSTPPIALIVASITVIIVIAFAVMFVVHVQLQKKRNKRIEDEIILGFQGLLEKEKEERNRDPETGMGGTKELRFDAFVSYDSNSADAEFVISLLEELEDKRGYKLCLNERDFMPGSGITDNIVECIGASKRIILILSRSFASSPWCRYEVQVALAELHQRRKEQLLVSVLLEDVSMDDNFSSNIKTFLPLAPCIKPPAYTANDDKQWISFWDELIHLMPQPINIV